MRRVLTGIFVCLASFAMVGGCQAEPPSKHCACAKANGCQCPLPGRPKQPSGGASQGGGEAARHEEHVGHREHRLAHREHGMAAHERHAEGHGRRMEARETHSRWREAEREYRPGYAALDYGYRSRSRAYPLEEGHPHFGRPTHRYAEAEASGDMYAYGDRRRAHRMHPYAEAERDYGPDYEENGPSPDGDFGARGESGYGPEPFAGPDDGEAEMNAGADSRMSINTPSALDPWHGYGVDCPELPDSE